MSSNFDTKLEYQYEFFKKKTLMNSREAIYTHAREIFLKRQIYNILKKLSKEEKSRLSKIDNIIDFVYLAIDESNINNVTRKMILNIIEL